MLTSLVYLKLANIKKSKVLIKIVNIDEKNLYIFLTTWGISMKFSGKVFLTIILKVAKNQGFSVSLQNAVISEKTTWWVKLNPIFFRVKKDGVQFDPSWNLFLAELLMPKMFSCEFWEIFKNTYFVKYLWSNHVPSDSIIQ